MPIEDPNAADTGALARRVERLTAAVVALAAGFALAVVWALAPRPEATAERFMLRDRTGRWRGALALDEQDRPTVRLNDANGRALLYGVVRADGTPRLRLSDASGRNRIVLELAPDGSPHARLLDAEGRTGVDARLPADGRPELEVRPGGILRYVTLPESAATGGPLRAR